MPIQQSYLGHLSVVGDAFCFGAALHHQTPVYLDIAGTSTSVEAVWGKLADGKEVRITPLGKTGADIVLQPVEKGTLQRIQRKVEGIALHHLLLVHKSIQEPLYAETSLTYMIIHDHDQASEMLGSHILNLTKIAVYPQWHKYLVKRGREIGLLHKCQCYGGVQVWALKLDRTDWECTITTGLRQKEIYLPD